MNRSTLNPPKDAPRGLPGLTPFKGLVNGPVVKNYKSITTLNQVYDTKKLNGVYHPANNTWQVRRNINTRSASIENSSDVPIAFAITLYLTGDIPSPMYTLLPSEVFYVSLNSSEAPTQILWPLDPISGDPIGPPTQLDRTVNSYVLRGGLNGVSVSKFHRVGF